MQIIMQISTVLLTFLVVSNTVSQCVAIEDDEFAEFEEFDDEEIVTTPPSVQQTPKNEPIKSSSEDKPVEKDNSHDHDAKIEADSDDEFEHFQDEEEFEGLDVDQSKKTGRDASPDSGSNKPPDLKITKVPLHLRNNWDSYYLELLMIAGIVVYFINFFNGRSKNYRLAQAWHSSHRQLFESQFALVGDDGQKEIEDDGLLKESENVYTFWCSGRVGVDGLLVELKLVKRQDLVWILAQMFRPSPDQIIVKAYMDGMDNFVMCVGAKKTVSRLAKEMTDLATFCTERKNVDKFGLPNNFSLLSEIGEVTTGILDARVIQTIASYSDCIDFIHISDQYSGPRLQEETPQAKLPDVKKMIVFSFNVPGKGSTSVKHMESMYPCIQFVFYVIDRVRQYRLSREAKAKSDKNRQRVEEAFMKTTHAQRMETSQQRREERIRAERERIMSEDDPDKQRKWEEIQHRREMKRRAPRMKQMKVKAI